MSNYNWNVWCLRFFHGFLAVVALISAIAAFWEHEVKIFPGLLLFAAMEVFTLLFLKTKPEKRARK